MRTDATRRSPARTATVVLAALVICTLSSCGGAAVPEAPKEKASISSATSYGNSYEDFSDSDLEALERFDIVAIEPYTVPGREFLGKLKRSGTIVLAYLSVGEADTGRRYWKGWEPTDRAPENRRIPRTTITRGDRVLIGEDPGWEGSYFVDASSEKWRGILLDEEIPYLLWLGGGAYDGLMMDVVDVVDEYEGRPSEERMRRGMVELIREIRERYPGLLLVPNRGFGILEGMAPYIDAFKFEEMTGAFGNVPGEAHYGEYFLLLDSKGERENTEQIDLLRGVLENHPLPVLVLDHVRTDPPDEEAARFCFEEARRVARQTGGKFIWYGNSVDQDLPIWPFLDLKDSATPGGSVHTWCLAPGVHFIALPQR